jgi:hypothetical protein
MKSIVKQPAVLAVIAGISSLTFAPASMAGIELLNLETDNGNTKVVLGC